MHLLDGRSLKLNPRQQRTIRQPVRLAGIGYWSSQDVTVEFRPALPNCGITFVRCDVKPVCRIRARIDHRIETPRRTTLERGSMSVEMVEHILAALAGMQIDNCEVWVNAAEMPGWDGSSRTAVEALAQAGIVRQEAWREVLYVTHPIRVGNDESWILAEPSTTPELILRYVLDFGKYSSIGHQEMEVKLRPTAFRREIAPARTFVLDADAERMKAIGLGAKITYRDLLVFGNQGPIDNSLRFSNECVRHKILDMVGDLALLEADIHGRITAHRSGHQLNAELVRSLHELRIANAWKKTA
jgi:UDP-3-O-acyl N-acetylglucosamine deacetylase